MGEAIYIFSNGGLRRKGNTLFYKSEDGEEKFLPVRGIDEVMVFGEVDLNKRLLELLSRQKVLLHYFSYSGHYMGTFYPEEGYSSGQTLLAQAECYLDPQRRLGLARALVDGASRNMLQVLRYYERRGRDVAQTRDLIEKLAGEPLASCSSVDELLAVEGNIRNSYYQAFDKVVCRPDFTFEKRTRRPPKNRMNALISFGNSLLYAVALSEVHKTHLDPRIGYLHATNSRRFALNLDVAEIFKPTLVDRCVFTLVDRGQVSAGSFRETGEGVFLAEAARRDFLAEFDRRLETTIAHRPLRRRVSYRTLVRMELHKVERHVLGVEPYQPFVARW